jgi:HSP20 family protein
MITGGNNNMTLVRWDPLQSVTDLQNRINRIFDDSLTRTGELDNNVAVCAWRPAVDIYSTDHGLVIKAELAGVRKEDVSVEVRDNVLTLKGERKPDEKIKDENYYRRERCFGTFLRAFTLQHAVFPDKVKAKFKDGVLEVEIPEPEEEKPKQITIDVE